MVLDINGVVFKIDSDGKNLEVLISPEDVAEWEGFCKYCDGLQKDDFWQNEKLSRLRELKNKYNGFLLNQRVEKDDKSEFYRFKAEFKSDKEDEAFFAVLNCVVRPFMLYGLELNKN